MQQVLESFLMGAGSPPEHPVPLFVPFALAQSNLSMHTLPVGQLPGKLGTEEAAQEEAAEETLAASHFAQLPFWLPVRQETTAPGVAGDAHTSL